MDCKGEIQSIYRDMSGKTIAVFALDCDPAALEQYQNKPVNVKVSEKHEKRSLNANSYMWELCGKIADKLSGEGTTVTKEEVYRQSIKECGVWRDIEMPTQGVETLRTVWERQGTGWITEKVDMLPNKDGYLIRCYYGSSLYNTKQMSRLISNLVQDCENMGVEHRTPEEINNLLSLWEQKRNAK